MSDAERAEFAELALAHAGELSRSIDDPKAILRNLAEWIKENAPARVATAYWIKVSGDRDKGIEVRLYEKPIGKLGAFKLRLGALLGQESGGASLTIPFRTNSWWEIGVGLGAVVDYQTFKDVSAVGVLTVRF